jgi:hypothetical protein
MFINMLFAFFFVKTFGDCPFTSFQGIPGRSAQAVVQVVAIDIWPREIFQQ